MASVALPNTAPPGIRVRLDTWLLEIDDFDLVAMLLLVSLMFYGDGAWYARVAVRAMAPLALVFVTVRRSPIFWLALTTLLATSVFHEWWAKDNHKYLMAYSAFAMWLAVQADEPMAVIRTNARWLLCGVFGYAVIWKVCSSDFLDGRFMLYEMLFDERFSVVADAIARPPAGAAQANRDAIARLTDWSPGVTQVALQGVDRLRPWAVGLTWWTMVIEGAIAVVLLLSQRWAQMLRAPLIIAFVGSTYLIAPVLGFGCVLLTLGLAQSRRDWTYSRAGYVCAFVALQFYSSPWKGIAGMAHVD